MLSFYIIKLWRHSLYINQQRSCSRGPGKYMEDTDSGKSNKQVAKCHKLSWRQRANFKRSSKLQRIDHNSPQIIHDCTDIFCWYQRSNFEAICGEENWFKHDSKFVIAEKWRQYSYNLWTRGNTNNVIITKTEIPTMWIWTIRSTLVGERERSTTVSTIRNNIAYFSTPRYLHVKVIFVLPMSLY